MEFNVKRIGSFCSWLQSQRHRRDSVGKAARYVSSTRSFPSGSSRLQVLLRWFDTNVAPTDERGPREWIVSAHRRWRRVRRHTSLPLRYVDIGELKSIEPPVIVPYSEPIEMHVEWEPTDAFSAWVRATGPAENGLLPCEGFRGVFPDESDPLGPIFITITDGPLPDGHVKLDVVRN